MRGHGCDGKPVWSALYGIVALLVAVVGLIEVYVQPGVSRQMLEVATVVAGFVSIRVWLRSNRAALELAQGRHRR